MIEFYAFESLENHGFCIPLSVLNANTFRAMQKRPSKRKFVESVCSFRLPHIDETDYVFECIHEKACRTRCNPRLEAVERQCEVQMQKAKQLESQLKIASDERDRLYTLSCALAQKSKTLETQLDDEKMRRCDATQELSKLRSNKQLSTQQYLEFVKDVHDAVSSVDKNSACTSFYMQICMLLEMFEDHSQCAAEKSDLRVDPRTQVTRVMQEARSAHLSHRSLHVQQA